MCFTQCTQLFWTCCARQGTAGMGCRVPDSRGTSGSDEKPPFSVLVAPARRDAGDTSIVLVGDRDAGLGKSPMSTLAALFALTPAEAHLALALAEGRHLEEVANERGVTRETVRSQLKAAFAKTGTHNQVGLVRLMLSVPTTLSASARGADPDE